jgi:hypothetical protein
MTGPTQNARHEKFKTKDPNRKTPIVRSQRTLPNKDPQLKIPNVKSPAGVLAQKVPHKRYTKHPDEIHNERSQTKYPAGKLPNGNTQRTTRSRKIPNEISFHVSNLTISWVSRKLVVMSESEYVHVLYIHLYIEHACILSTV